MKINALKKIEYLEEELEILELRILEAIWSMERALESQNDLLKELKIQIDEFKTTLGSICQKQSSSMGTLKP